MKKNKMMRVAAVMLVCVLLSTSIISGTFAKYVTSDSVSDSARVAKWGVTVRTSGSLYSESYTRHSSEITTTAFSDTVVTSSTGTKVVAPGTSCNTGGMDFSITGKPEVAVKVDVAVTVQDVVLPTGWYLDYTTGTPDDEFQVTTEYHPVKYTLTHTPVDGTEETLVTKGTLAEVETALEGIIGTSGGYYPVNTDLGKSGENCAGLGAYHLTWEWEFPATANATTDKMDTLLGQIAAGEPAVLTGSTHDPVGSGYEHETSFAITITVTQVD